MTALSATSRTCAGGEGCGRRRRPGGHCRVQRLHMRSQTRVLQHCSDFGSPLWSCENLCCLHSSACTTSRWPSSCRRQLRACCWHHPPVVAHPPHLQVLRELAADAQLDRFRSEYEKVFRALKKSHDNEKRLIKKCRELGAEIVGGAAKVQAALKLSDEDQATIAALKKEIENSWKMVDSSHEKVGQGRVWEMGREADGGGARWCEARRAMPSCRQGQLDGERHAAQLK